MPQVPPGADIDRPRLLAVDFGMKRIGLALSDPLLIFAYPFTTLTRDKNFWNKLEEIINEKNISKIILGYPFNDNGGKSEIAVEIEKFAFELKKRFKKEIIFWDERYTSVIAQEKILESVPKKSKRRDKGLIDRNSAAIILQEYINSLN